MNQQKLKPSVLAFYAHTLTLCAALLSRDVPIPQGIVQATALGMIAWLMINRRQLDDG